MRASAPGAKDVPLTFRYADANLKEPRFKDGHEIIGIRDQWKTSAAQSKTPHVGVWLLEPRLTRDELAARLQASLLAYPRFRQKVVEDAMGAQWVEDEAFDLSVAEAVTDTNVTLTVEPASLSIPAGGSAVFTLTADVTLVDWKDLEGNVVVSGTSHLLHIPYWLRVWPVGGARGR